MGFDGIAKSVAVLACAGSMFGCAAPLQPKTLSTNTTLSKEIRVRTHDAGGFTIGEGTVRDAIASALITGGNAPRTYQETFEQSQTFDTYGIRAKGTADGIEVEYLNGPKIMTAQPPYFQSRIAAKFPLSITKTENGELYNAVLQFPSTVSLEPPPFLPFTSGRYALKEENIIPNLLSKFNALDNERVAIGSILDVKGEVTVEASPDAVRGNFERVLGKYYNGYQYSDSSYTLSYKGNKYPVNVKLYPYRNNGCKVQFSVTVNYTVSNTTSITQSDIEAIKRRIESVAKD